MTSDIERAVIINPDLQRLHTKLYTQMDASRMLVSRLATQLLPGVRNHPDGVNATPGRANFLYRAMGAEQWVGMSQDAVAGPHISTFGNGSRRLSDLNILQKELAFESLQGTPPEEVKIDYGHRFMITLAEASLVQHSLRAAGVRLSIHGDGAVSSADLTSDFKGWLANDPKCSAVYDDSLPLWEQPFVTVPQLPPASK